MPRALVIGTAYTCTLLILCMCVFALQAMVVHEWTRWQKCESQCLNMFKHNAQLLSSPICCPIQGQHYGERLRNECLRAQDENALTTWQCKTRKFWQESEVRRVYNMYAESHWMLFGIGSIGVLSFVVSMFLFGCTSMFYGYTNKGSMTQNENANVNLDIVKQFNEALEQHIERLNKNEFAKRLHSIPSYMHQDYIHDNYIHNNDNETKPLILKPKLILKPILRPTLNSKKEKIN
jgi:hypothetical protein